MIPRLASAGGFLNGTRRGTLVLFFNLGYNKSGPFSDGKKGARTMANQEDLDIIELEGDDGEVLRLLVERYFFYNGEEYVLLSDEIDLPEGEEVSRYVMKVQPVEGEDGDEDMEEFVPVDEDLMEQLIQVVEATFDDEDDEEEP